ncbi:Membrane-bound lytic murein transglycosylase D [Vibrio stylophorae]|uniref:Membrane-bound lytic murein transglycosylase D n=1 Tax=Vibrio stylophorae TaxID=659351 RepID=A0ABM8ZV43_9VIBR|nr:LysM peptidoglycan-binding domain-containing protein [Vibrio stylophorae]CAH0534199.1 Membrane-bound lytic murein transglycosylase D [Vibrio stylophorae]
MKRIAFLTSALILSGCQLVPQKSTESESGTPIQEPQVMTPVTPKEAEPQIPVVLTPQQQEDLWNRIGMQLEMAVPEDERVDYYRDWYVKKHPNHLKIVAKRADPFMYLIVEQIEERGLPLELALLPIVESSFDPFAYSHGSAAGLWQFIPSTGRRFGLEQNWWYDGRRDVVKGTEAALDLMEYLYKRFDGNWLHALAAYNTGEGRVLRAIKANKKAGKPTDFWHLDLPKETRGYVPKLLALSDIIKHKDQYDVELPVIQNHAKLKVVDPGIQMDLAMAAQYADMTVTELQSFNPAYNHWATAPEGPNHFLLPIGKVDVFTSNMAKNGNKGMKVVRYKIQPGDSLSVIAEKHQTTVAVIKRANNLGSNSIRVGKHLLIPVAMKDASHYGLSSDQRLDRIQDRAHGGHRITHVVESGDSFWSLAKKYKVSVANLAEWNGMAPKDSLRIGQKLAVWQQPAPQAIMRTVIHQVRSGDSLSTIADKYRVSVDSIIKLNNLNKKSYLQPGQKLKIRVDVTKMSS